MNWTCCSFSFTSPDSNASIASGNGKSGANISVLLLSQHCQRLLRPRSSLYDKAPQYGRIFLELFNTSNICVSVIVTASALRAIL